MNLILFLLRASSRIVYLSMFVAFIAGLSTAGVLIFIRFWIIKSHEETSVLVFAFVGVCLGALLSKLVSQVLLIGLSRRALSRLIMQLSRGVLAVPLHQLERMGSTRLQFTLTRDVQGIAQGLRAVPLVCANAAIVASCLAFMGYLSWQVLIITAVFLGIGMLIQLWLLRKAQRHNTRVRDGQEDVSGQIEQMLEGIKELKSHRGRREAFLNKVLQESIDIQEKQGSKSQFYLSLTDMVGRGVLFALLGFILLGLPVVLGPQPHSAMIGYVLIVFFLMTPLGTIKHLLPQMGRAKSAMEKVQALGVDLSARAEPGEEAGGPSPFPAKFGTLDVSGVSYTYHGGPGESPFTLGPLDLVFRPGEIVFLAGGNGSGKTTFAKLLTGLYVPKSGQISVDGQFVSTQAREHYRQLFSVVFSEFHLFQGLLGLESPGLIDRAKELLKRFRLDGKVRVFDGSFSNTTRLSRGQRKRLALLVAILEDRPFYVLDEWAADQDPHFKELFYTELLPELKAAGKALLVITHDDRYYPLADRLLTLEDGQLRSADENDRRDAGPTVTAKMTGGTPVPR
jgi:putative ATP-binding cassette transporter